MSFFVPYFFKLITLLNSSADENLRKFRKGNCSQKKPTVKVSENVKYQPLSADFLADIWEFIFILCKNKKHHCQKAERNFLPVY